MIISGHAQGSDMCAPIYEQSVMLLHQINPKHTMEGRLPGGIAYTNLFNVTYFMILSDKEFTPKSA